MLFFIRFILFFVSINKFKIPKIPKTMSTFNGKVKSVKLKVTSNQNSLLITVEIEDTAHSVDKVNVDLPVKATPNPTQCAHSGEIAGICIYKGNTVTAKPISGSSIDVIVKLYDKDNNLLLSETHAATVDKVYP